VPGEGNQVKYSTRFPREYAVRISLSTSFSKLSRCLFGAGSLLSVCLSASSPAHASGSEIKLLDALLALESSHASLCQSTVSAAETRTQVEALSSSVRDEFDSLDLPKTEWVDVDSRMRAETEVRLLNGIIFGRMGMRSSQDLHDPCNLFLSSVLARKQGYCVGIAALYLSVAEALELPIHAVATPTHVLLRYDDGTTRINIETSNGGVSTPDEQYVSQQRIAPKSIRKGVFLNDLSTKQYLAQVHNNLGVIYSERREYARADAEYDAALRLDKRLPVARYNRGKNLIEQGDLEGAIRSFTKALRLHPNDTWALNNRGLADRQLGRTEKARADFEAALRIDPSFEQAKANLAALRAPR
jgi:regulator of sirC expression with transglutaminase-like and TPR domain